MLLLVGPCSHFMKRENKSTFSISIFFSKEIDHNGHTHFAHSQILESELNVLCNLLIQVPCFCPSFMESYHTEHFNALLWHLLFQEANSQWPSTGSLCWKGARQDVSHRGGKRYRAEPVCAYPKGNSGIVSLVKSFREQKEVHRQVLCRISFLHRCVGKCNTVEIAVFIRKTVVG